METRAEGAIANAVVVSTIGWARRGVGGDAELFCRERDSMERAGEPLCERGAVAVETRREKYAGRLARLRRLLPVTVSGSWPRSSSSLGGGGRSADLRPRRRSERTEEVTGAEGASEKSSSAEVSGCMLRDTTLLAVMADTEEVRWCSEGIIERWLVVEGRRAYAREEA